MEWVPINDALLDRHSLSVWREKWSTKPGGGGGGLLKPHLSGGAQNQSSARGVSVSGVDINGSHNSFLNWQPSPSHPQWASAAANAKNEPSSVEPIFQPTGDFYYKQSSFGKRSVNSFVLSTIWDHKRLRIFWISALQPDIEPSRHMAAMVSMIRNIDR